MTELIRRLTDKYTNKEKFDAFTPGDTVNVHVKVKEGEKERIQIYKGVVIKIQKSGVGRSFTVRKMSNGVGVERTFPFASPAIEKVEALARGKVRRSRLYYLRALRGKAARLETEIVAPTKKKEKKEKKSKKKSAAAAE